MDSDRPSKPVRKILRQAKLLGYIYRSKSKNFWFIDLQQNWLLTGREGRWLLSLNAIPLVYLSDEQVLSFLANKQVMVDNGHIKIVYRLEILGGAIDIL